MKIKSSKFDDQQFVDAVNSSTSIKESLRKLNLAASGTAYSIFHSRVVALSLDISHFGKSEVKREYRFRNKRELEEILVENSTYNSTKDIKKRLLQEGLLEYSCSICSISEWNGNRLSLHLDHINGIRTDNRIENLRLLCPNCHSQTETYAGKNIKKRRIENCCIDCGTIITKGCIRCVSCNISFSSPPKIEWPSVEILKEMVEKTSYVSVGKHLGVSDNAVRKHIRVHSNVK